MSGSPSQKKKKRGGPFTLLGKSNAENTGSMLLCSRCFSLHGDSGDNRTNVGRVESFASGQLNILAGKKSI